MKLYTFPTPLNGTSGVLQSDAPGSAPIIGQTDIEPVFQRPGLSFTIPPSIPSNIGATLQFSNTDTSYQWGQNRARLVYGVDAPGMPEGEAGWLGDDFHAVKTGSGPTPPPFKDDIPIDQIVFEGNCGGGAPNIGQFTMTAGLTALTLYAYGDPQHPAGDVYVQFTKQDSWPSGNPPGWDGPIQFSIGLVYKVNGQWYGSAPIECWPAQGGNPARYYAGGPIQQQNVSGSKGQILANWFYNASWWPHLSQYQPKAGDTLGCFVCSGDARNNVFFGSPAVMERTNIVAFQLPPQSQTLKVL